MSCIVNKNLKGEQKRGEKMAFLKGLPLNLSGLPQKDCRNTVEYKTHKLDEVKLHRPTHRYLQDNVLVFGFLFFYGAVKGLCLSSTRLPMQINFSKKKSKIK